MPRPILTQLLTFAILPLASCAQRAPDNRSDVMAPPPPYFVPTSAIVQNQDTTPALPTLAANILPSSDAFFAFPRGERNALGTTPLYEYSAYAIYTYDAQPIGIRHHEYGYRYRSLFETGVFALPPIPLTSKSTRRPHLNPLILQDLP